jgi:hypothetical protein
MLTALISIVCMAMGNASNTGLGSYSLPQPGLI